MNKCVICGEKTGIFSKKTTDGAVCRECIKYIPDCFILSNADSHALLRFIERSKEYKKAFEPTAFYGNLYLDSVHSMLCYSKTGKEGSPLSYGDIYKVTELKEIGLFCTNPRRVGTTSRVVCDVKLSIKTLDIQTQYIVAYQKQCQTVHNNDGTVSCCDPVELTVIRNLLNQMFEDVRQGLGKKAAEIQRLIELSKRKVKQDKEKAKYEWARGILYIENENYSLEEVKRRYRELGRIFHPDIHPELPDDYMAMLNSAYSLLKDERSNGHG